MRNLLGFLVGLLAAVTLSLPYVVEATPKRVRKQPTVMDAQFHREAGDAVRPIIDTDGDVGCSAVVVEPNVAVTAAHCIDTMVSVAGLAVESATISIGTDGARLVVPGLACPCATVDLNLPEIGEKIYAAGYPYYGPTDQGKLVSMGPGTVTRYGTLNAVFGAECPPRERLCMMHFIHVAPAMLDGGMSGGGAFVLRNGHWFLIGTNSIGYGTVKNPRVEAGSGFTWIGVIR